MSPAQPFFYLATRQPGYRNKGHLWRSRTPLHTCSPCVTAIAAGDPDSEQPDARCPAARSRYLHMSPVQPFFYLHDISGTVPGANCHHTHTPAYTAHPTPYQHPCTMTLLVYESHIPPACRRHKNLLILTTAQTSSDCRTPAALGHVPVNLTARLPSRKNNAAALPHNHNNRLLQTTQPPNARSPAARSSYLHRPPSRSSSTSNSTTNRFD